MARMSAAGVARGRRPLLLLLRRRLTSPCGASTPSPSPRTACCRSAARAWRCAQRRVLLAAAGAATTQQHAPVRFVLHRDLRHQRVIRVRVAQQGADGQQHLRRRTAAVRTMHLRLCASPRRSAGGAPWTPSARGSTGPSECPGRCCPAPAAAGGGSAERASTQALKTGCCCLRACALMLGWYTLVRNCTCARAAAAAAGVNTRRRHAAQRESRARAHARALGGRKG